MIHTTPDFMEWVIVDEKGWHLKENAPKDVKKKFDDFMKEIKGEENPS
jgi:hypothetical protein